MNVKKLSKNSKRGFHLLAGINRAITPSQVTKLAISIEKLGIVRPVVIAKISFLDGVVKNYIIDGQHLYTACLRLKLDIPYVEIEIGNLQELIESIALMNATSKSWLMMDYLQAWSNLSPAYEKLRFYYEKYDIAIAELASLFHNGSISERRNTRFIKDGTFKIRQEKLCVEFLDVYADILKLVPRTDRGANKTLLEVFHSFYIQYRDVYNHKKMLAYLSKNKDKFVLLTQDPEEYKKTLINTL